jgi:Ras-related protein Rab-2A
LLKDENKFYSIKKLMQNQKESELTLKVVIVGDSGVGKTSFIDCIKNGPNHLAKNITTGKILNFDLMKGPEYVTERLTLDNIPIKVCVWDTAGQEQYRAINRTFYRQAEGAIIMSDLSLLPKKENLEFWLKELKGYANSGIKIAIVANKCDLEKNRDTYNICNEFARENSFPFYEASAKTGENVKAAFYTLIKEVKDAFHADFKPQEKPTNVIRLSSVNARDHSENNVSRCC